LFEGGELGLLWEEGVGWDWVHFGWRVGGVDVMNEGFFVICALPRNREYLVIFAGARVERVRSIRSLPTSAIELVTDLGWG